MSASACGGHYDRGCSLRDEQLLYLRVFIWMLQAFKQRVALEKQSQIACLALNRSFAHSAALQKGAPTPPYTHTHTHTHTHTVALKTAATLCEQVNSSITAFL